MRVLDVAAGTGNVAVRAAEAGADVVASDLTPENLAAGRARGRGARDRARLGRGRRRGAAVRRRRLRRRHIRVRRDVRPGPRAAARELLRVCRPGGTIALASFTPDGLAGDFFATLGRHAPPPEGEPPLRWGTEEHLRELLGDAVAALQLRARGATSRASRADRPDYAAFFTETFGPLIALRAMLADDPQRLAALDRDLLAFAQRANAGAPERPVAYPYDYLLAVARTVP